MFTQQLLAAPPDGAPNPVRLSDGHRNVPSVYTWDDHETLNDIYGMAEVDFVHDRALGNRVDPMGKHFGNRRLLLLGRSGGRRAESRFGLERSRSRAMRFLAGCVSNPTPAPSLPGAAAAGAPNIRAIEINAAQGSAYIDDQVYTELSPDNARIEISQAEQRARVYAGDRLAIDTPVSTGVSAHPTPSGLFTILEKKPAHERKKGTFYFFGFLGRPRGRSEDSSPSWTAVDCCHAESPKGVPRERL